MEGEGGGGGLAFKKEANGERSPFVHHATPTPPLPLPQLSCILPSPFNATDHDYSSTTTVGHDFVSPGCEKAQPPLICAYGT